MLACFSFSLRCFSVFCIAALLAPAAQASDEPVRFLLTFDDGPGLSASQPTQRVLQQLKDNPYAAGIKALFFEQTQHEDHGGSAAGQAMMREQCAEGHLLAVHSGTARGHVSHTAMGAAELAVSLRQGKYDIEAQCGGTQSGLVRPPNWGFNDATLQAYRDNGLALLLTDMSAADGKIYGYHISLRRRSHLHSELQSVAAARDAGVLPADAGVLPVIMTFHDVNPYTATHLTEYMQILVEESKAIGLPLADPPFYTDTEAMHHAALMRAQGAGFVCHGASLSVTLYERLFWYASGFIQGLFAGAPVIVAGWVRGRSSRSRTGRFLRRSDVRSNE